MSTPTSVLDEIKAGKELSQSELREKARQRAEAEERARVEWNANLERYRGLVLADAENDLYGAGYPSPALAQVARALGVHESWVRSDLERAALVVAERKRDEAANATLTARRAEAAKCRNPITIDADIASERERIATGLRAALEKAIGELPLDRLRELLIEREKSAPKWAGLDEAKERDCAAGTERDLVRRGAFSDFYRGIATPKKRACSSAAIRPNCYTDVNR